MLDWQISKNGNPWATAQGHRVVVYPVGGKFSFRIDLPSDEPYVSASQYETVKQAQDGATEALRKLIEWS